MKLKGTKMDKNNWEYNYEGKTYRIQSIGELMVKINFII